MIRIAVLAAAAAIALGACTSLPKSAPEPSPDPASARTLSLGQTVGYVDPDYGAQVWRGLPFARPPVGDLRWRAPRDPEAWSGQRLALKSSERCPQMLSALDGVPAKRHGEIVGSEDCLYLDVYAPAMSPEAARNARLPVMVWIHGGGNTWGRADQYNAAAMAARRKVVVVVIQYRLGALGWFAHDALRRSAAEPLDGSANFGTLDQIRALHWVRDEIAAFGGDPGLVTVFGESAGGHNVAALLASPLARGLFQRAIIQSGSFRTETLAAAEGASGDNPNAAVPVARRIVGDGGAISAEALRAAPLQAVLGAYSKRRGDYDPPRVIADGVVIPEGGILQALGSPDYRPVPLMIGSNRDEVKLFNALNPELVDFVLGRLPRARDPALYEAMSAYPSRMWRANSVDRPAAMLTSLGRGPVYAYRFDWDEAGKVLTSDLSKLLGAGHSIEIPFVFGHFHFLGAFDRFVFTKANAPGRLELSGAMMDYWTQFARTGAPGRGAEGRLPEWTAVPAQAGQPRVMILDSAAGGGLRMSADTEDAGLILRQALADPAIRDQSQRCALVGRLLRERPDLVSEAGVCASAAPAAAD